jgi:hypothetical protein
MVTLPHLQTMIFASLLVYSLEDLEYVLQIQQQIAEEYERMKGIVNTLELFKVDIQVERPLGE